MSHYIYRLAPRNPRRRPYLVRHKAGVTCYTAVNKTDALRQAHTQFGPKGGPFRVLTHPRRRKE